MLHHGALTVATSYPALSPWFIDNAPWNQKGYEAGVAYDVAKALGFDAKAVTWYSEPYELSEESGSKPFDFDINEFIYEKSLSSTVSFSTGYFNVNQSLVALHSDAIVTDHTPKELKTYLYGAVAGSPGLAFAIDEIKPDKAPTAYSSMTDAIAALNAGEIDAIVVDVPTGQYIATEQLTGGVQVGQFRTTGERYVLVLEHQSSLTYCVDKAIHAIAADGTLSALSKRWLKVYNAIPVLQP